MKYLIYINLVFLTFLTSCGDTVQEINWETENVPQKLVVEGEITNELSTHPIVLKYSDDYFVDNPARRVSEAIITVQNDDTTIYYVENAEIPGQYEAELPYRGKVNSDYHLNIQLKQEIDGNSTYTAHTSIIEGLQLESIKAELYENPIAFDEEDSLIVGVFFYGQEPEEIKNYYLFKVYRNDSLLVDTINQYGHFSDQQLGINGEEVFFLFFQEQFFAGDTIGIEILSIPEEYNYFLNGVDQISQPGDPFGFSGPPANAIGNISEGKGLGFFFGAHVAYSETILIDKTGE
jgi:hypothetical protein